MPKVISTPEERLIEQHVVLALIGIDRPTGVKDFPKNYLHPFQSAAPSNFQLTWKRGTSYKLRASFPSKINSELPVIALL